MSDHPYRTPGTPGVVGRIRGLDDTYFFWLIISSFIFVVVVSAIAWGASTGIIRASKEVVPGSYMPPCTDMAFKSGHWKKTICNHPDHIGRMVDGDFICECQPRPVEKWHRDGQGRWK